MRHRLYRHLVGARLVMARLMENATLVHRGGFFVGPDSLELVLKESLVELVKHLFPLSGGCRLSVMLRRQHN